MLARGVRNAPPSILNVQVGQPVELRVSRRLNEDYVPPPKRFNVFEGQGNRLGSALPVGAAPSASSQQPPGAFPSGGNASGAGQDRSSLTTKFEVDMSAPTTSVQIRLADGTRYVPVRQRAKQRHSLALGLGSWLE